MSNIADLIEDYILRQLSARQDGQVELKRTEIADEMSCAPSQISYVLSTRFTPAKGFVVESRRGLGGFIRIVQVPLKNIVYRDIAAKITEKTELSEVETIVRYLVANEMMTRREAALFSTVAGSLYKAEEIEASTRASLIKAMLLTLDNYS